ncbi:MAG: DUF3035 domain-containing protein [Thermaurantiacus sp.]|uniref:DUF3035 domain-containing protein n=1 Tax=Thermaurantiacus sp. TaxID=2820283 RepID=UPI00298EE968|nr:DUF3035 domain-containing protein [Thermaurantiacus sp.]MDW8414103.1 DUF3035 domain-containing protein [Thermaurantiacus sp.]
MNRSWIVGLVALCLMGCSGSLAERERPDELAVIRAAPLVIPPDFTLAPPRPGAPRPLAADSQQQALEALFGPGVTLPPKSPLEQDLMELSGGDRVDPMIRSYAGELKGPAQATVAVDKGAFLRELLDAPAQSRNPGVARLTVPAGARG